jgi:hypothetical protein
MNFGIVEESPSTKRTAGLRAAELDCASTIVLMKITKKQNSLNGFMG